MIISPRFGSSSLYENLLTRTKSPAERVGCMLIDSTLTRAVKIFTIMKKEIENSKALVTSVEKTLNIFTQGILLLSIEFDASGVDFGSMF